MSLECTKIEELQKQVAGLQEAVALLEGKKKNTNTLRGLVDVVPISNVLGLKGVPEFSFATNNDTWGNFLKLGKMLHEGCTMFTSRYSRCTPGYLGTVKEREVKNLSDLSDEEKELSAQMISEMAEIYNRYYRKVHETVLVNTLIDNEGEYHEVKVIDK